jgi:uncharacterized protein (DUF2249 family)
MNSDPVGDLGDADRVRCPLDHVEHLLATFAHRPNLSDPQVTGSSTRHHPTVVNTTNTYENRWNLLNWPWRRWVPQEQGGHVVTSLIHIQATADRGPLGQHTLRDRGDELLAELRAKVALAADLQLPLARRDEVRDRLIDFCSVRLVRHLLATDQVLYSWPPGRRRRACSCARCVPSTTPGESFVLVNNHDPKPLRREFQAAYPDRFGWDYLEAGPERWRVRIGRPTVDA